MNHKTRRTLLSGRPGHPPLPRALAVLLLGGAALAGCVAVPDARHQLHPTTAAEAGLNHAELAPLAVAPEWWHDLHDPQLDRIMADALAGSPTLEDAGARLRVVQALIANAKAGLLPQVSGDVGSTYELLSNKYIYPAPLGGSGRWLSDAEVDIGWTLDLAGRQHEMVRATRTFARSTALQVEAAKVALSGSVAQTYVNLARAEAQERIAREFVANREASLKLTQNRRAAALATEIDLAAAQTLLAQARQALVRAEGQRALMVHALAALAGRGADYYSSIGPTSLRPEATLPVPQNLPADLLARRADLLAAQLQVEMAAHGEKIQRAAFYPDVNLRGFAGLQALGIGSLFTGGAAMAGVGPALHLPIFEGGALKARYRASVAGSDVAIAQYNKAVLNAVKEAADALSAVETNRADAEQQAEVVDGLQKTVSLDRVRLDSGLAARFDLLSSNERLLSARQAQVDLAADGALRRIQLLVAVGGGFTPIPDSASGQKLASAAQR